MNNNYALYFPTIEFNNPRWLRSAALIWDRIYRIVPEGYNPNESRIIKELTLDGTIGEYIRPEKYSDKFCDMFIEKCASGFFGAASVEHYTKMNSQYIKLHKSKADVKLRNMILAKDMRNSQWLNVPEHIASLYMLYLANYIADECNISLITDKVEAWCGANYFSHDGNLWDAPVNSNEEIVALMIQDFIPSNIMDASSNELLKFREKRSDERHRFVSLINELAKSISQCKDETIVYDLINDSKKEINESIREYKKSMIDLKVKTWTGVKSLMIPVAMPVATAFFQMPDSLKGILQAVGIAVGVVAGFYDERTQKERLKKNFQYSYLLEIKDYFERIGPCYAREYDSYLNYVLNNFIHD